MNPKIFTYNEMSGIKKEADIKHFKLKKLFGYRYRYIAECDYYEFLPSYFKISYSPEPMLLSNHKIKLLIPFMQQNHGISIGRDTRQDEIINDDLTVRKIKKVHTTRIMFY